MKAELLLRRRVVLAPHVFAELVIWRLPEPLRNSVHRFKYRLALVCTGICLLRYDIEAGKGDHRHWGDQEMPHRFETVERLVAAFQRDSQRMREENERCRS